jgi:hypothetical protein
MCMFGWAFNKRDFKLYFKTLIWLWLSVGDPVHKATRWGLERVDENNLTLQAEWLFLRNVNSWPLGHKKATLPLHHSLIRVECEVM